MSTSWGFRPFFSDWKLKTFSDWVVQKTAIPSRVRRFLSSEEGPTAVEYAVMLALIIVPVVAIVGALGHTVSGTFSTASGSLGS